MPNLIYFFNKIENCGCYSYTIDDGTTQTSGAVTSGCGSVNECGCYVPYTWTFNPPSAATYFAADMLTPVGPVTADGSIEITFDLDMPPSTCKFESDLTTYANIPLLAIRRSNTYNGSSATFPYIYNDLAGGFQVPPFDNAEAVITWSASGPTTLVLDNIIVVPYNGYLPGYNYQIILEDYNGCRSSITLHDTIPYEFVSAVPIGSTCGVNVQRYVVNITHNSLTPIAAGAIVGIDWTSTTIGAIVNPVLSVYGTSDITGNFVSVNTSNAEFTTDIDWAPGDVLRIQLDYDNVGCVAETIEVEVFPLSNQQDYTNYPLIITA